MCAHVLWCVPWSRHICSCAFECKCVRLCGADDTWTRPEVSENGKLPHAQTECYKENDAIAQPANDAPVIEKRQKTSLTRPADRRARCGRFSLSLSLSPSLSVEMSFSIP